MLIEIGVLGTVHKDLEEEVEELDIRGQVETIETTALLKSARILRVALETLGTLGDLLLPRLQGKIA